VEQVALISFMSIWVYITVERRLSELMWGEGCLDNRKVHIIKHLVSKSIIQGCTVVLSLQIVQSNGSSM